MVWDYPINDSLWINALTVLLIGFVWLAFLSLVTVISIATGRGLRELVDTTNDWYQRHPV